MNKKWLLWLVVLGFVLVVALVPIWAFPNLENQLTTESQSLEIFDSWSICEIEFHGRNGYLTVPSNMNSDIAEDIAEAVDEIKGVRNVQINYTGLPIEKIIVEAEEINTEADMQVVQQAIKELLLNNVIEFESGTAELTEESISAISDIAMILKDYPDTDINIVGHTDTKGNANDNVTLSLERAQAVVDELIVQGINEDRLIADGKGDTEPIASNDTEEGRKQNRRVEFKEWEN